MQEQVAKMKDMLDPATMDDLDLVLSGPESFAPLTESDVETDHEVQRSIPAVEPVFPTAVSLLMFAMDGSSSWRATRRTG